MRIALVTATYPPYLGGTGNVCFNNARVLAALGHDVHVFTSAAAGGGMAGEAEWDASDDGDVTVHRLKPLFRVGNAPCLPQLRKFSRRRGVFSGFDVVHLHYPFPFGAEWVALSLRRRFAFVMTHHQDLWTPKGLWRPIRFVYDATVKRFLLRRAARVFVPTLDYARTSSLAAWVDRPGGAVVELPNGVDVERFTPGPSPHGLRERYGIPAGARVVNFVGGLDTPHHFKGVDVLLAAAAKADSSFHYVLVGDGDLRAGFETLAGELGLEDRVHFAGRVPELELSQHYRLGDVTVLPSINHEEIFGLVLAEAMACGRPVIASNLPGVRTVVAPGETGLLVPPRDVDALAAALDDLLADPVRLGAWGKNGRRRVEERYSWDAIGRQLASLYEEVA